MQSCFDIGITSGDGTFKFASIYIVAQGHEVYPVARNCDFGQHVVKRNSRQWALKFPGRRLAFILHHSLAALLHNRERITLLYFVNIRRSLRVFLPLPEGWGSGKYRILKDLGTKDFSGPETQTNCPC